MIGGNNARPARDSVYAGAMQVVIGKKESGQVKMRDLS